MPKKDLGILLAALAAGDSLGSTTEFTSREEVIEIHEQHRGKGWPFAHVGGGYFNWKPGQLTDDGETAAIMVRSYLHCDGFDPEDVAARLVKWAETDPKDVGTTTLMGIARIKEGAPWYEGGLRDFQRRPMNASNGSLLRNGVIPGMAETLSDAYRFSLYQSIMTHYAPRPVLSCALHTYLIWKFLVNENPLEFNWLAKKSWLRIFRESWTDWLDESTDDPVVSGWRENVGTELDKAWTILKESDFDPDSYSPFVFSPRGGAGYVLTTLQIAIWATNWSLRREPFKVPEGYPHKVFDRVGPWVLGWVAMTGGDTDSYGATTGPIIAAAHKGLPAELLEGLEILGDFPELTITSSNV